MRGWRRGWWRGGQIDRRRGECRSVGMRSTRCIGRHKWVSVQMIGRCVRKEKNKPEHGRKGGDIEKTEESVAYGCYLESGKLTHINTRCGKDICPPRSFPRIPVTFAPHERSPAVNVGVSSFSRGDPEPGIPPAVRATEACITKASVTERTRH